MRRAISIETDLLRIQGEIRATAEMTLHRYAIPLGMNSVTGFMRRSKRTPRMTDARISIARLRHHER